MAKRLAIIGSFSLILGTIVGASTASSFQMMCSDYFTNTREMGVSIGKCDLNFISVKEMNSIEDICGTPGTVDTPAATKCRIRAIVSPSAENHGQLYKVLEVLTIDKRRDVRSPHTPMPSPEV
jgi:hypothetical protein